jgi:hypothetical protein
VKAVALNGVNGFVSIPIVGRCNTVDNGVERFKPGIELLLLAKFPLGMNYIVTYSFFGKVTTLGRVEFLVFFLRV